MFHWWGACWHPVFQGRPIHSFDNDEVHKDYAAEEQHMLMLNMAARVAAILLGPHLLGTHRVPQEGGGEPAVLHPKTMAEFRLPWMPWRLPIMRAMTRSLTFWPPSVMWSCWPTNQEKTNPHSKRASFLCGGCLTGYPWHVLTNWRKLISMNYTVGQNRK